jgi:hypothetical protein
MWPAVCALILLLGGVACERWPDVTWENATSLQVVIYEDGAFAFRLGPQESREVSTSEDIWRPDFKAVGQDGRVLLEGHITWDKLEEMGFRIVITDPESRPAVSTGTPGWPTPSPQPTALAHSTPPPALAHSTPPPAACWGRGPQSPSAPNAPTNLRAELVSSPLALEGQLVRLQWDDNADDEQCYVIEQKVGEGDWSVYEAVGGAPPSNMGTASTEIVPLEPGVHRYRVYFGNEEGRSAYSNEASLNVDVLPRIATPTPGPFYTRPAPAPPTPAPVPALATPVVPTFGLPPDCNAVGPSPEAPDAPSHLDISLWSLGDVPPDFGPSIVEFGWDDNSDDENCFVLMFEGPWVTWEGTRANETVFSKVLVVGEGSASNSLLFGEALEAGEAQPAEGGPDTWCYYVFAANQQGRSEPSNRVCLYLAGPLPTAVPTPSATPPQPRFAGPEQSPVPEVTPTQQG